MQEKPGKTRQRREVGETMMSGVGQSGTNAKTRGPTCGKYKKLGNENEKKKKKKKRTKATWFVVSARSAPRCAVD
jgi:hypothetical protein